MNELATTSQSTALVEAESQRAIGEIQASLVIAKKFPRDERRAMDRILMAATRPKLAESALYSYSRGGSDVTGPSIRLAEALAQAWGNVQFGIKELEQRDGESTVQAFAWDVEINTRREMTFQVSHTRHTKQGIKKLTDPRDIYEMVANQGARRLRACILGIIPGDVVESAVQQVEVTLNTQAEVTPERIKTLLEKFAAFGVTKAQIEKRIQRRLDAITPALIVQLGKIYNSMKDGMSASADWFEADSEKPKFDVIPEAKATAKATPLEALGNLIKASRITAKDVLAYVKAEDQGDFATLEEMGEDIARNLITAWPDIVEQLKGVTK
jgi:hypothetical protein